MKKKKISPEDKAKIDSFTERFARLLIEQARWNLKEKDKNRKMQKNEIIEKNSDNTKN